MYSWNPVFKFYKTVREAFVDNFGSNPAMLWGYDKFNDSCLAHWTRNLAAKSAEYAYMADIVSCLTVKEYLGILLVRYRRLAEVCVPGEDFFEKYDGFYAEARTVVIDVVNDALIAAPFRKFRNLDECESYSYENISKRIARANKIEFTDKMDGSMVVARWYLGEPYVFSSTGINRKENEHVDRFYTWIENHSNITYMLKKYNDFTFIFEAIFPESDPHIVPYSKEDEGLYVLGMRNIYTGEELGYSKVFSIADEFGCPHPEKFNIQSIESIMREIKKNGMNDSGREGYVVNIDGFKVKMKFMDYVFKHYAVGNNISSKTVIDAIRNDYIDDLTAICPQNVKPCLNNLVDKVMRYIAIHKEKSSFYWEEACKSVPSLDSKELSIWIGKNVPKEYKAGVFAIKNGKDIDWLYGRNLRMIDSFLLSL